MEVVRRSRACSLKVRRGEGPVATPPAGLSAVALATAEASAQPVARG
jgi:hypothetical protein